MYFRIWESKRLMGLKIHQDSAHGLWKYWTINGKYVLYITLINHVGRFHDPRICQLHYVGSSNKVRIFVQYSYIHANTWEFGWSYIYGIIHMNRYSSWCYSLHISFITTLSLKLPTLFTIFIWALFIICININLFLFSKFLFMSVR